MLYINEDNTYFHLLCIISTGVERGEKLEGLAHVGEHLCLIQYEEDTSYCIFTSGYTCFDHACLYFSSKSKEYLKQIEKRIQDLSIIRMDRLDIAKHQVISECKQLENRFCKYKQIVQFVTEGRQNSFASGKIGDIQKIRLEDVEEWLRNIVNCKKLSFFYLDEWKKESIWNNEHKNRVVCSALLKEEATEEILYIENRNKKVRNVQIYMPLEIIRGQKSYLELLIGEYHLKERLQIFGVEIDVEEKYFSFEDRYIVIELHDFLIEKLSDVIDCLRNQCFMRKEYEASKIKFVKMVQDIRNSYEKKYEDIVNEIINQFVYEIDVIDIQEDREIFSCIENELADVIIHCLKKKWKIVIQ